MHSFEFDLRDRTFEKTFICSRRHNHQFFFYFRLEGRVLSKVGQSPSMADIEQGSVPEIVKLQGGFLPADHKGRQAG